MTLVAGSAWAVTGWHRVSEQVPIRGGYAELNATYAASATDIWAAGDAGDQGQFKRRAILEHSTGGRFQAVAAPEPSRAGEPAFYGMGGTGSSDVWAVGSYGDAHNPGHSLIEHYDGNAWAVMAYPAGEPHGSELDAVSADSPTDGTGRR